MHPDDETWKSNKWVSPSGMRWAIWVMAGDNNVEVWCNGNKVLGGFWSVSEARTWVLNNWQEPRKRDTDPQGIKAQPQPTLEIEEPAETPRSWAWPGYSVTRGED